MKQGLYILLNKASDFDSGICYGARFQNEGNGITLTDDFQNGYFISRLYDSRKSGMEWHRICLNCQTPINSSVTVRVYTCDSEREAERFRKNFNSIRNLIISDDSDGKSTENQLKNVTETSISDNLFKLPEDWKNYLSQSFTGFDEVLLDSTQGRYLWVVLEFKRNFETIPEIREIRIEFPRRSYLDYLPEIYRQDEESAAFVHRYLSLFQKMDEQLEDKIEDVPAYLDPCVTQREYLEWLSELLGLESTGIWTDEQLRYLLKNASDLYRIRGTKDYLSRLVELYTKQKPIIIQYYENTDQEEIYCSNPFEFALLLRQPEKMNTDIFQNIKKIIEISKPAWMDYKLVILRPYMFMDQYSYTGINTVLGQYRPAMLNDEIMIPFGTVAENNADSGEDAN